MSLGQGLLSIGKALCFLYVTFILLLVIGSEKYERVLFPGALVELKSYSFFWYDKASVRGVPVVPNKQIYFGSDCGSKVKESTSSSPHYFLNLTHPERLDDELYRVYLLKGSHLILKAIRNPYSFIKLCRFTDEQSVMALTSARDKQAIQEAEQSAKVCYFVDRSPNASTISDKVKDNGYQYYALSLLSPFNESVGISYSYVLYTNYYNESSFELQHCPTSGECSITGLTFLRSSNPRKNNFCVLAYVPLLPSANEKTKYTFTTTLSNPYASIAIVSFLIVVFNACLFAVLFCNRKFIIGAIKPKRR